MGTEKAVQPDVPVLPDVPAEPDASVQRRADWSLRLDHAGAIAPFEQIRTQLSAMIADGSLARGDKLPTVRQLALDLGLAVNTVAKAYRQLEVDGLISTDGRRGSFVRSLVAEGSTRAPEVRAAAKEYLTAARRAGLSLPEAVRLVEQGWGHPST
jgi:DNA-binding transcriptional regulator YhcF (GntR family)